MPRTLQRCPQMTKRTERKVLGFRVSRGGGGGKAKRQVDGVRWHGGGGGRDGLEGGEIPPPPPAPLQGAQPMPSHFPPDTKCQSQ